MAIQGLRHSGNFSADERPKNFREGILRLNPNGDTPLTGLTSMMSKRTVDDPEFSWWEKSLQTRRHILDATTGDLTTVNTQILLDAAATGLTLKDGDLLWVEQTNEIMQVNGDPSSNVEITVIRGVAGSTAATLDPNAAGINPNLNVIGSAYEEGSLAPTGIGYDPTKKFNYTQIFRDTIEMTRTASKTKLRTGDQLKEAKREALELHAIGIEKAFWFGSRQETTKNGKPIRYFGGFNYLMTNHDSGSRVVTAGATTDLETFEEYLYEIFKYGSTQKFGMCGNRALLTINQLIRKNSSYQISNIPTSFGMDVVKIVSPFGTLMLKTHPLFNQMVGGVTGGTAYAGVESWLAVLDLANFKYVCLTDGDTKFQDNLQVPGMDGLQSGWITECALEISLPDTHYLIKGLVGAATDT